MFLSGLLPRPMSSDDDKKLLELGIGFTNIVERTTRGSACLSRNEIVEGNIFLKGPFDNDVIQIKLPSVRKNRCHTHTFLPSVDLYTLM